MILLKGGLFKRLFQDKVRGFYSENFYLEENIHASSWEQQIG